MDTTVENISGTAPEKKDTLPIPLPGEMLDWAIQNEPLISRLSKSFSVVSTPLPADDVWKLIAENYSDDWKEKHDELQRTEKQLAQLMSPENKPLGLVGAALHSDETNAAEDKHTKALVDFTITNETLRQQDDLHKLMGALLAYQETVTKSLDLSRDVRGITSAFGSVAALEQDTPEAGSAFMKAATKEKEPEGLSSSFLQKASKFFGLSSAAPEPKEETPEPAQHKAKTSGMQL
ncbi:MAG: hypothetical protein EPN97_11825 [Alphaproteobacteria bacterium]|nr:MAG: hypothetical protein EPN97_11825 [Alphaproteobacteria bacterium]